MDTLSSRERYFIVLFILSLSIGLINIPASAQCITAVTHMCAKLEETTPEPTNTPDAQGTITHKIEVGDTAWDICERYGMELEELYALNNIDAETVLYVGDELLIAAERTATVMPTLDETSESILPIVKVSVTPQPTETESSPTASPVARRTVEMPSSSQMMRGLVVASFIISAILIFLCATFCMKNKPPKR